MKKRKNILATAILCALVGMPQIVGAEILYGEYWVASSGKNVSGQSVEVNAYNSYNGAVGGLTAQLGGSWGDDFEKSGVSRADNNTVVVNGGDLTGKEIKIGNWYSEKISAAVIGGVGYFASKNYVEINAGTIKDNIFGGYVLVRNSKDKNNIDKSISNNHVVIEGGTIDSSSDRNPVSIAGVASSELTGNKNIYANNSVTINGGNIGQDKAVNIYGARSLDTNSVLNDNKVIINGGNITSIFVADQDYISGINGAAGKKKGTSASRNIVEINDGNIKGDIFAAQVHDDSNSVIDSNVVYINGGTIEGNVSAIRLQTSTGKVYENGIEINGAKDNIDLSKASLFGVHLGTNFDDTLEYRKNSKGLYLQIDAYDGAIKEVIAFDNVLIDQDSKVIINDADKVKNFNVIGSSAELGSISNFDNININNQNDKTKTLNLGKLHGEKFGTISTDSQFKATSIDGLQRLDVNMNFIKWQKDDVIIDVSGTADLTNTKVNVDGTFGVAADTELKNGDRMSLIKAGELKGVNAADITDNKVLQGFAKEVEVKLEDGTNSIDFVISGVASASDQTEIIGQSRAAAYAFVNQGSDALNAVFNGLDDGQYGIKTFAVVHGNRSKYDVGNDIKVNGWSVLTGVGDKKKLSNGDISWGVFYENGTANYRTFNDYNGMDLTGYGSSVYNGGGALARYEADNGIYTELGARLGTLKNSLQGAVIDGLGKIGGYDVRTSYYGAHVGIGKKINTSEDSHVDVYGKYFYVQYDDEHLNILGDDVYFGSADSNRLRIGARYNKTMADEMSGYIGLAWEHEFSGDSNVTTAGFDVDNAELEGDTAVMELGIKLTPEKSKWDFDLGVQGYLGAREGFSGNVQVTYNF